MYKYCADSAQTKLIDKSYGFYNPIFIFWKLIKKKKGNKPYHYPKKTKCQKVDLVAEMWVGKQVPVIQLLKNI